MDHKFSHSSVLWNDHPGLDECCKQHYKATALLDIREKFDGKAQKICVSLLHVERLCTTIKLE